MVAWLFLLLVIAMPVTLGLLSLRRRPASAEIRKERIILSLYASRRRSEVARFKTDTERDAEHLRRALDDELEHKRCV